MCKLSLAGLLCLVFTFASSQTGSTKYQTGTIIGVERHQESDSNASTQYDVSVQIEDTIYILLYTPSHGAKTVEYAVGIDRLFLVNYDKLITPVVPDGQAELPILRTRKLSPKAAIDWSKAPGQYFSMKMKNLTQNLNLSDEQRAKIKPIAEQESAEAGGVIFTDVVPRKERLNQWGKIVRKSDAKMKSILSEVQWRKLQEMRKNQKRELTDLIAGQEGKIKE